MDSGGYGCCQSGKCNCCRSAILNCLLGGRDGSGNFVGQNEGRGGGGGCWVLLVIVA